MICIAKSSKNVGDIQKILSSNCKITGPAIVDAQREHVRSLVGELVPIRNRIAIDDLPDAENEEACAQDLDWVQSN